MLKEYFSAERMQEQELRLVVDRAAIVMTIVNLARLNDEKQIKHLMFTTLKDRKFVNECGKYWLSVNQRNRQLENLDKKYPPKNGLISLGYIWGYRQHHVKNRRQYAQYDLADVAGHFNEIHGIFVRDLSALPHEQNHALYARCREMYKKISGESQTYTEEKTQIQNAFTKCQEYFRNNPDLAKTSPEWSFFIDKLIDYAKTEMLAELEVGNYKWHRRNLTDKKGNYFNDFIKWINTSVGGDKLVEDKEITAEFYKDYQKSLKEYTQKVFEISDKYKKDAVWNTKKELLWFILASLPMEHWNNAVERLGLHEETATYEEVNLLKEIFKPGSDATVEDNSVWGVVETTWNEIALGISKNPSGNNTPQLKEFAEILENLS